MCIFCGCAGVEKYHLSKCVWAGLIVGNNDSVHVCEQG